MLGLWWFLLSRAFIGGTSAGTGKTHFLHAVLHTLPLLGIDYGDHFGGEDIVLRSAARKKVITDLNIRHRNAVTATAQGGLFVEFDGLDYIVGAQDGKLGCVDRFDFTDYIVFAENPCFAFDSTARATAVSSAAAFASALCIRGASADHLGGPGVVGIFVTANTHEVAHFKIGALGGLAISTKFGFISQLNGYGIAIQFDNIDRSVVDGRNLAKQRQLSIFALGLPGSGGGILAV
ncbi:MAG TPA: hypothetical protein VGI16_16195 [Candidatus Acidoferrum sp.]|jgi:hypothetical protein